MPFIYVTEDQVELLAGAVNDLVYNVGNEDDDPSLSWLTDAILVLIAIGAEQHYIEYARGVYARLAAQADRDEDSDS